MAITAETPYNNYTGNGVTTAFTGNFTIFATGNVAVYLDAVLQTSGYTVTGTTNPFTVTFTTAPASGVLVTLKRDLAYARETDYAEGGSFRADTHDADIDKVVAMIQQIGQQGGAAIKAPVGEEGGTLDKTEWDNRTNKVVGYNASNVLSLINTTAGTTTVQTYELVSTYGTLAAAVAAIGGTSVTLLIDIPNTVSADLTIPANISLVGDISGITTIASSKTLTINGSFQAGLYRCFDCVGTGALTGLKESRPEWFGVVNGAADEVQVNLAIQSAHKVIISKIYAIASPVIVKSDTTLEGMGWTTGFIANSGTVFNRMITSSSTVQQKNIVIRDLKVDRSGTGSQHGIIMGGIDGLLIENVWVFGYDPIQVSGALGVSVFDEFADIESKNVTIQNCRIERANNFGVAFGFVTSGSILNNKFVDCYREAIGIESYNNGADGIVDGNKDIIVTGNSISVNKLYETGDGTVGPAVLIGSAGITGRTSGVVFTNNTIDCGDLTGNDANGNSLAIYQGIVFIGGVAGGANPSGNVIIAQNIIRNTPSIAIGLGTLGSETNNTIIDSNIIINPNIASAKAAIYIRTADKTKITNNIIRGTAFTYGVEESSMSVGFGSTLINNHIDHGTLGQYLLVGQSTTLLDPGIYHSATSTMPTSGALPKVSIETITLDDDATGTFTPRGINSRGVYILTTNYGSGSSFMWEQSGITAPNVMVPVQPLVASGAINPNVDGKVNVFPSDAIHIGVKNRLGSTRNFTLFSINP